MNCFTHNFMFLDVDLTLSFSSIFSSQHVKDSETTMSKLLSNSYEREWHEQNRTKQAEQHGEAPTMVKEEKTVQGEHNTNDGHSPPTGATRSGRLISQNLPYFSFFLF